MDCTNCGQEMVKMAGIYPYHESGLKNVTLVNIPMYKCPACKETEVEIPRLEELHLLLAFLIVLQPDPLKGDEVRYLRKNLGYSQEELANLSGVTRVTVTRWESGRTIRKDQDKQLRRLYLSKKRYGLTKVTEVNRIFAALVDRLPLDRKKRERRIRIEDWASPVPA